MIKSLRVPPELLALSQMQRAATREAGAPLYLPAFEAAILGDPRDEDDLVAEADFGAEAGSFILGDDEDDDFY